jgi:enhancing lycopene biosynthesis protein 2
VKRRIGVLLSGCGAYDGTDPYEAVLSILAIQLAGHEAVALALDSPQMHVVDHTTAQEAEGEGRHQFVESARLVRGKLFPLPEISPKLLDGLVIPGGQGTVKNLCTGFGTLDPRQPEVSVGGFLKAAHEHGVVIGAVSLAEFLISSQFGPWPDGKGCFDLLPDQVLVDAPRRLLLTPGNTSAVDIKQLFQGIQNLIADMLTLIESK